MRPDRAGTAHAVAPAVFVQSRTAAPGVHVATTACCAHPLPPRPMTRDHSGDVLEANRYQQSGAAEVPSNRYDSRPPFTTSDVPEGTGGLSAPR